MTTTETTEHEGEEQHEHLPAVPDGGGEIVPMRKEELVAWLKGADITDDDASDELAYEMALRILQAEDASAMLAQDDVRPVRELVGEAFTVRSVAWRKSTKSENGEGRYAVMACVDRDGEAFLSSCGATKVVLQLRKAQIEGWLPMTFVLNEETTSNNRTVYELIAPPAGDNGKPDF
jgi:hypothetical protein